MQQLLKNSKEQAQILLKDSEDAETTGEFNKKNGEQHDHAWPPTQSARDTTAIVYTLPAPGKHLLPMQNFGTEHA